MADGTVGISQASQPDRQIDNELLTIGGQPVYRQRVLASWTIGTYAGAAGVSGTVNVPAGAVVRSYAAQAGATNATLTVPGITGTISIPGSNQASTQFADNPDPGTMVGPCTFVFNNTAGYVVVWVI